MDGRLAVIPNTDEIMKYLRDNNYGGMSAWYWVGANDYQTPGSFQWSTGDAVHGIWRDAEPWADLPGKMCVYFTDHGFGKTPCSDQTWFICQANLIR